MNTSINIIVPIVFCLALASCEQDDSLAGHQDSNSVETSDAIHTIEKYLNENSNHQQSDEISSVKASPFNDTHSGEVLETFKASQLTYVNIKSATGSIWAAGPLTEIKPGDIVGFKGETAMKNFHSKSLNRTFELIYFVNAFTIK